MYQIMLIEDDYSLAEAMKKTLEQYGNHVHIISDFHSIMDEFREENPKLVLMDIMLPYMDGYFWCAQIRRESSVPVVFISSASDNMNIIMAINMGGDDFIPKPVDAAILQAKVQAILRRTYEMKDNNSQMEFYGAILNIADCSVSFQQNREELTKNEFRILQVLLENRGTIVSREKLMTRLWQNDLYVEENTLTVNVSRLRKKLLEMGLGEVIVTKPGSGYIIK